jgi:hypothetical protein
MPAPGLLFCDTDCLLQLLIANQVALLKWLKARYGMAAVIVPEVELEAVSTSRYRNRFEHGLRKAIAAGALSVFDYSRPEEQLTGVAAAAQADITMKAIVDTGRRLSLRIGRGEAYSHAACVHLGMPLLSHDISAIEVLAQNKMRAAAPTLRVFDLIALANGRGRMSARECDSARQALHGAGEFLPRAFRNASFEEGLRYFRRRLFDLEECTAGEPPQCTRYDDPLFLGPA